MSRPDVECAILNIAVQPASDFEGFNAQITFSGRDPFKALGLVGMDPQDVLGADAPLIPVGAGTRDVVIGRCPCGEAGCDSLVVGISREGENIVWSKPLAGRNRWPFGRVHFKASQYIAEVQRASSDLSWETPSRSASRMLADRIDVRALAEQGFRFQWSSWLDDQFTLALFLDRGPYQVLLRVPWDGRVPETAVEKSLQILARDPVTWDVAEWLPQFSAKNPAPPDCAGPGWRQHAMGS